MNKITNRIDDLERVVLRPDNDQVEVTTLNWGVDDDITTQIEIISLAEFRQRYNRDPQGVRVDWS